VKQKQGRVDQPKDRLSSEPFLPPLGGFGLESLVHIVSTCGAVPQYVHLAMRRTADTVGLAMQLDPEFLVPLKMLGIQDVADSLLVL